MEVLPAGFFHSISRYWRRRGYERLDGVTENCRKRVRVQSSRTGVGRRRCRIQLPFRLRMGYPKRLLLRLRDSYVDFMLRLSNSPSVSNSISVSRVDLGRNSFRPPPLRHYDEKVLINIYRKLIAQGRLLPGH